MLEDQLAEDAEEAAAGVPLVPVPAFIMGSLEVPRFVLHSFGGQGMPSRSRQDVRCVRNVGSQ